VCAVLTADCLPLLLCNEGGDRVAAVHAGWRGLLAGVIEQAVKQFACPGETMLAWLGPAIGPDAFEVGAEVREMFVGLEHQASDAFKKHGDKWLCDIYQLARQRLVSLGVSQITGGGYCTYHDAKQFYSYRRDGTTGRMASLIYIT
jgi:YfiH family protein